jgi:hypothetical protein
MSLALTGKKQRLFAHKLNKKVSLKIDPASIYVIELILLVFRIHFGLLQNQATTQQ